MRGRDVPERDSEMRSSKEMLEELRSSLLRVVGYDENEGEENESESENDEEGSEEESEGDEEESEDEDDESDKDTANLKKALRAERKRARIAERERDKLKKEADKATNKSKSDSERLQMENTELKTKTQRLAEGFRDNAVDSAIIKQASTMKFRDIDDALRLIDRSKIEVDQDEDDPRDIDIDETTVTDALKALAKKKPHLLIASGDKDASGGNLGTKKKSDELDDDKLRELYPALRR